MIRIGHAIDFLYFRIKGIMDISDPVTGGSSFDPHFSVTRKKKSFPSFLGSVDMHFEQGRGCNEATPLVRARL